MVIKAENSTAIFERSLCKGLESAAIEKLLSEPEVRLKRYKKGEYIFRMDQPITHVGLILNGSVEIQKIFYSGKVVSFMYKETGDIIAEGAIFSSLQHYPCQVAARERTDIFLLPKQYILKAITSNPILSANVLTLLSDKVVMLNKKVELLSFCSIQSKIAFSLLHCLPTVANSSRIELPYPKKTWAEHLNVSRPSLCREVRNLCDQDIIQVNKRSITILDRDSLEEMLNE